MNDEQARQARISDKIAASQVRLWGDLPEILPLPFKSARKLPPDAYPPEHVSTLAGQYPLLTLAAGALAAGFMQRLSKLLRR